MLIANRHGTRFEMLMAPSPASPTGVPIPYASPEAFLSSFTPAQRAEMLRALGASHAFPGLDLRALRTTPSTSAETELLARLVRARRISFAHPSARATTSGISTTAAARREEPAPPPPPPPVREEVVCELMAVAASCSHNGRRANRAGLLEVVPGRDDDLVRLQAEMRGGCGEHARWEIRSPFSGQTVKTGARSSFVARSWGFKALGIFEVQPKSYFIACTCCSGPVKQLEVRAYPLDEWEIALGIDLKKPPTQWKIDVKITPWEETSLTLKTDVLRKFNDRAERVKWALDKMLVPVVGKSGDWKFLETQAKFSGKWVEHDADHRCYYAYNASLELDPLLEGSFLIPFGPTSAIPPWIKRWTTDLIGDLYLYLKFEGKITLAGKWSKSNPDRASASVEGAGKITVKAGGNLFLMKRGALNLDVNGSTSITAEAKAPVARKPAVEYDVKWGGLEIELTIEAAWGMVEYKRKWKPIEGCSLLEKALGRKPEPWYPFGA